MLQIIVFTSQYYKRPAQRRDRDAQPKSIVSVYQSQLLDLIRFLYRALGFGSILSLPKDQQGFRLEYVTGTKSVYMRVFYLAGLVCQGWAEANIPNSGGASVSRSKLGTKKQEAETVVNTATLNEAEAYVQRYFAEGKNSFPSLFSTPYAQMLLLSLLELPAPLEYVTSSHTEDFICLRVLNCLLSPETDDDNLLTSLITLIPSDGEAKAPPSLIQSKQQQFDQLRAAVAEFCQPENPEKIFFDRLLSYVAERLNLPDAVLETKLSPKNLNVIGIFTHLNCNHTLKNLRETKPDSARLLSELPEKIAEELTARNTLLEKNGGLDNPYCAALWEKPLLAIDQVVAALKWSIHHLPLGKPPLLAEDAKLGAKDIISKLALRLEIEIEAKGDVEENGEEKNDLVRSTGFGGVRRRAVSSASVRKKIEFYHQLIVIKLAQAYGPVSVRKAMIGQALSLINTQLEQDPPRSRPEREDCLAQLILLAKTIEPNLLFAFGREADSVKKALQKIVKNYKIKCDITYIQDFCIQFSAIPCFEELQSDFKKDTPVLLQNRESQIKKLFDNHFKSVFEDRQRRNQLVNELIELDFPEARQPPDFIYVYFPRFLSIFLRGSGLERGIMNWAGELDPSPGNADKLRQCCFAIIDLTSRGRRNEGIKNQLFNLVIQQLLTHLVWEDGRQTVRSCLKLLHTAHDIISKSELGSPLASFLGGLPNGSHLKISHAYFEDETHVLAAKLFCEFKLDNVAQVFSDFKPLVIFSPEELRGFAESEESPSKSILGFPIDKSFFALLKGYLSEEDHAELKDFLKNRRGDLQVQRTMAKIMLGHFHKRFAQDQRRLLFSFIQNAKKCDSYLTSIDEKSSSQPMRTPQFTKLIEDEKLSHSNACIFIRSEHDFSCIHVKNGIPQPEQKIILKSNSRFERLESLIFQLDKRVDKDGYLLLTPEAIKIITSNTSYIKAENSLDTFLSDVSNAIWKRKNPEGYFFKIVTSLMVESKDQKHIILTAKRIAGLITTVRGLFHDTQLGKSKGSLDKSWVVSRVIEAANKLIPNYFSSFSAQLGSLTVLFKNLNDFISGMRLAGDLGRIRSGKRDRPVFQIPILKDLFNQKHISLAVMKILWVLSDYTQLPLDKRPGFIHQNLEIADIERLVEFERSKQSAPHFLRVTALLAYLRGLPQDGLNNDDRRRIKRLERHFLKQHPWPDQSREEELADRCSEWLTQEIKQQKHPRSESKQTVSELASRMEYVFRAQPDLKFTSADDAKDTALQFLSSLLGRAGQIELVDKLQERPSLSDLLTLLRQAISLLSQSQHWQVWLKLLQQLSPGLEIKASNNRNYFNDFLAGLKEIQDEKISKPVILHCLLSIQSSLHDQPSVFDRLVNQKQLHVAEWVKRIYSQWKSPEVTKNKAENLAHLFKSLMDELEKDSSLPISYQTMAKLATMRRTIEAEKLEDVNFAFLNELETEINKAAHSAQLQMLKDARSILTCVMTEAEISSSPQLWQDKLGKEASQLGLLQQDFMRWRDIAGALDFKVEGLKSSSLARETISLARETMITQYRKLLNSHPASMREIKSKETKYDQPKETKTIKSTQTHFAEIFQPGESVVVSFFKFYLSEGNTLEANPPQNQDYLNRITAGFIFNTGHEVLTKVLLLIFEILRPKSPRAFTLGPTTGFTEFNAINALENCAELFLNRLLLEWNETAHEKILNLQDQPDKLTTFIDDLIARARILFRAYSRPPLSINNREVPPLPIRKGDHTLDGSLSLLHHLYALYISNPTDYSKDAQEYIAKHCWRNGNNLIGYPTNNNKEIKVVAVKSEEEKRQALVLRAKALPVPNKLSTPFTLPQTVTEQKSEFKPLAFEDLIYNVMTWTSDDLSEAGLKSLAQVLAANTTDYAAQELIKNMVAAYANAGISRAEIVGALLKGLPPIPEPPRIRFLTQEPSTDQKSQINGRNEWLLIKIGGKYKLGFYNEFTSIFECAPLEDEKLIDQDIAEEMLMIERARGRGASPDKNEQTILNLNRVRENIIKGCLKNGVPLLASQFAWYKQWLWLARLASLQSLPETLKEFTREHWQALGIIDSDYQPQLTGGLQLYEEYWPEALPKKREAFLAKTGSKWPRVGLVESAFKAKVIEIKEDKGKSYLHINLDRLAQHWEELFKSVGISGYQQFGQDGIVPFDFNDTQTYATNIQRMLKNPSLSSCMLHYLAEKCVRDWQAALEREFKAEQLAPSAILHSAVAALRAQVAKVDDEQFGEHLLIHCESFANAIDEKQSNEKPIEILERQVQAFFDIFVTQDQQIHSLFLEKTLRWAVSQWRGDNGKLDLVVAILLSILHPNARFAPEELILSKLLAKAAPGDAKDLTAALDHGTPPITEWTLVERLNTLTPESKFQNSLSGSGLTNLTPLIQHYLREEKSSAAEFFARADFAKAYDLVSLVSLILRELGFNRDTVLIACRNLKTIQAELLNYLIGIKQKHLEEEKLSRYDATTARLDNLIHLLRQPIEVDADLAFAINDIPLDSRQVMQWCVNSGSEQNPLKKDWHKRLHEKCLAKQLRNALTNQPSSRERWKDLTKQSEDGGIEDVSLLPGLYIFNIMIAYVEWITFANQQFEEMSLGTSEWAKPVVSFLEQTSVYFDFDFFQEIKISNKEQYIKDTLDVSTVSDINVKYENFTKVIEVVCAILGKELAREMTAIDFPTQISEADLACITLEFPGMVCFLETNLGYELDLFSDELKSNKICINKNGNSLEFKVSSLSGTPIHGKISRQAFGEDIPETADIMSISHLTPYLPKIVEILEGRGHIKPAEEKILNYVDILFSNNPRSILPPKIRQSRCARLMENTIGIYATGQRDRTKNLTEVIMRSRIKLPLRAQLTKKALIYIRLLDNVPTPMPLMYLKELATCQLVLVMKKSQGQYDLGFINPPAIIKCSKPNLPEEEKAKVVKGQQVVIRKINEEYKIGFCGKKSQKYEEHSLFAANERKGINVEDKNAAALLDKAPEGLIGINQIAIRYAVTSACLVWEGEAHYLKDSKVADPDYPLCNRRPITDPDLTAQLDTYKPGIILDDKIQQKIFSMSMPPYPGTSAAPVSEPRLRISSSPQHSVLISPPPPQNVERKERGQNLRE